MKRHFLKNMLSSGVVLIVLVGWSSVASAQWTQRRHHHQGRLQHRGLAQRHRLARSSIDNGSFVVGDLSESGGKLRTSQ